MENLLKNKYLNYFIAIISIGIGVNMFLLSGLGSDPLTVLQEGIHIVLNITVGQASLVYNIFVLFFVFIFSRKELKVGTLLYCVLISVCIDFIAVIIPTNITLLFKFIYLIIGEVCIAYGFSKLIQCEIGMNALDIVIIRISVLIHIKYSYIRIFIDALFVLIGWFLGGQLGFGTVVSVVCTGYLIEFFLTNNNLNKYIY
ncbi:YczE/YyaS/YitT family protein [Anaerorhabdus sp.]|uniref:YczE/YyaS/YitT family protein n=1 Tax=Anaerorhabdus sp. TaxID=1872524 RepID=UPI002FCB1F64